MEKLSKIKLRKQLNKKDAIKLISWLENKKIMKFMNEDSSMIEVLRTILINHQEVLLTYFLNQYNNFYMIDHDYEAIGFISLKPKSDSCFEVVIAIGETEKWGHQFGKYSLQEIIKFSQEQNFKLVAKINFLNTRSIQLFEHVGFNKTGKINDYLVYELNPESNYR